MNQLILKSLLKTIKPQINPALETGEKELINYLNSIPLEENEKKAVVIVDYNCNNEAIIAIVTVDENLTIVRPVASFKKDKLIDLISNIL
jgi:hypothetical protein